MPERSYNHKFHRWLVGAEKYEEPWRRENQRAFEYYDGDQWTAEEKFRIRSRGQAPVVINLIKSTVDMIMSVEAERRIDVQVVGREESDDKMGTLLTALLKQVFDQSNLEYFHSQAFREGLIGGRGWVQLDVRSDSRGKDQIVIEQVPWEQIKVDPYCRRPDASDAKYIIREKWVDRDTAKKLFPSAADLLDSRFNDEYQGQEHEAQNSSPDRGVGFYYDSKTQRVKICECWYTVPECKDVKYIDEVTGKSKIKEVFEQTVHHVIFSDDIILDGSATDDSANENPLKVNVYPLVPIMCMRDSKGRPAGIVRQLMDIQDEINKLNSKLIHKFAVNRVTVEEGAVRDIEEFREEAQRPDGVMVLNEGGLSRSRIDDNTGDMGYMVNYLNWLIAMLQRISGVNDSTLGIGGTNERSGIMQSTRIAQGAAMHTSCLENMYYSKQRIAYVAMRLMGAYYTDYRVVRITEPNGTVDSYEFNKVELDEFGKPTGRILAKIEDTLDYDVIIKKVPPFNSIRERQLQIFSEVLKSVQLPPDIVSELLLSLSDIPNKDSLLMRIQGYAQQQQALQAQQQQAEMARMNAETANLEMMQ